VISATVSGADARRRIVISTMAAKTITKATIPSRAAFCQRINQKAEG
jgi:hypothetical protein